MLVSPSDALACIHLRGGKPDVLLQVLKGRKIEASERLLVTRMRHHGTLLHALIERNYTTALKAVLEVRVRRWIIKRRIAMYSQRGEPLRRRVLRFL